MASEKPTAKALAPVPSSSPPPLNPPQPTVPVVISRATAEDDSESTISQEKSEAARQFASKARTRTSFFGTFMKGKQPASTTETPGLKQQNGASSSAGPSGTQQAENNSEPELTRGHRAVVKTLEERYNSKGYQMIREPGFFSFTSTDMYKTKAKPVEEKWSQFALCVIRHFDKFQKYQKSTLEIKSDYIKRSLSRIIRNYQGISFLAQTVKLEYPLKCLYHNMDAIIEEKNKRTGEWRDHLELLINFCKDEFKDITKEVNSLVPQGLVSSEILWTIFKPGEIFLTSMYGKLRALKLVNFSDMKFLNTLTGSYIDYDGKKFIKQQTSVYIKAFSGVEKITDLGAYPLSFHPKQDEIRTQLLARGRKFEGFKGIHPADYEGIGIVTSCMSKATTGNFSGAMHKYNVSGRVMVDAETYYRMNPNRVLVQNDTSASNKRSPHQMDEYERTQLEFERRNNLNPEEDVSFAANEDDQLRAGVDTLTDEQCIISTATVCGFAFGEKVWVEFYIDNLKPVAWNKEAFNSLVLSSDQKALIKALVDSHTKEQELSKHSRPKMTTTNEKGEVIIFDDFVRGKGRGLIGILHGPPGVGKTLTAESVAEFVQRPLYSVSSGELGTTPADVERSLTTILDVAKVWNAVLLLDEADVFLEQRSSRDVVRNALVSVFLRMLEYYQGILFLTSNRVGTFDEAFQSRMHVAIRYPLLNEPARREVWVNFMKMLRGETGQGVALSEEDLDDLAKIELNGRQIKNAIKTAKSLADSEGGGLGNAGGKQVPLQKRHLIVVLRLQKEFEENFGESKRVERVERLGLPGAGLIGKSR